MPSSSTDERTSVCFQFILRHLLPHRQTSQCPLIVGLNGVQGVGKTTLAATLATMLEDDGVRTLVFSLDDFYLRHADQEALAAENPGNALVQHRGEPGTHDVELMRQVFSALMDNRPTMIPRYDKALHNGQGDRLPAEHWRPVNQAGQGPVHVVIFEGWAVGFRPLEAEQVEAKWKAQSRTLHKHALDHILFVNQRLGLYDAVTDLLHVLIHIDSEDAEYVYAWREEQEQELRLVAGAGMTPEQVVRFVDGYFPAYELYTEGLRRGIFPPDRTACQLRVVVGRDRMVKHLAEI